MKATLACIAPTEAAVEAGRPCLTPEMLAATGAKYSRNNEGLESIISKIDFGTRKGVMDSIEEWMLCCYEDGLESIDVNNEIEVLCRLATKLAESTKANLDKGVDGIFKMIDYGHQSIADMCPVAVFMDDVSLYLAYHLWSMCSVVGGQESSTRYIKISIDGIIDHNQLGISDEKYPAWKKNVEDGFTNYQKSVDFWTKLSTDNPGVMRIPESVLNDTSEKGLKVIDRMRRNYVFDRSRYFLPMGAATNVMMVMSAREWVALVNDLLSSPHKEFNTLGEMLLPELALITPRMIKHAQASSSTIDLLTDEYESLQQNVDNIWDEVKDEEDTPGSTAPIPYLFVDYPLDINPSVDFPKAMAHRKNRYSRFGHALRRTMVRFGWNAVAMAEIRDLNRHRTGEKYCPLVPLGFYAALDQVPSGVNCDELSSLARWGYDMSAVARENFKSGDWGYMYDTFLGTQFPFEHTTTANKFIYEAELRTGMGAHYRYAAHLKGVLGLFYHEFPETKGLIIEGGAEPE